MKKEFEIYRIELLNIFKMFPVTGYDNSKTVKLRKMKFNLALS